MSSSQKSSSNRGQRSSHNTGTADVNEIAQTLSVLARELQEYDDPDTMLHALIRAAVDMVPGADEGSISVVSKRRHVYSEAPTSDLPRLVDTLQEKTQQGPCLTSAFDKQTVRVADMATETRWPLFAAHAAQAGAASMLSIQLYVEADNLGALNLVSRTPNAFDDESEQIGLLFAAHAAIAYIGARKEADFVSGLNSRDLIGQAKGILMERYQISAERAFLLLSRISQNRNQKLPLVAAELVRTRTIAGPHGISPVKSDR